MKPTQSPNTQSKEVESWKVEFTRRFVIEKNNQGLPFVTNPVAVKDFIDSLLSSTRQQVQEEIVGKAMSCCKDEFNNYTLTGEQIEEKISLLKETTK